MTPAAQSCLNTLINIAERLQHTDGELEAYAGRYVYPSTEFADDVVDVSRVLADAAVTFSRVAPGQSDLAIRLARAATDVSEDGGTLETMSQHRSTFGSDWGTALDSPITIVNQAIRALMSA